jgi:hypothetical protein
MNRVINILTKRKKKEAKKKEKITTITNLFCLLFPGQDNLRRESRRVGTGCKT